MPTDCTDPKIAERIQLNQAIGEAMIEATPKGWQAIELSVDWRSADKGMQLSLYSPVSGDRQLVNDKLTRFTARLDEHRSKFDLHWEQAKFTISAVTRDFWDLTVEFFLPPAEHVAALFDSYADHFDEHLVGELGYRAPEQLHAAVTAATSGQQLDIMDLGCGTGLCGQLFRPLAKTLVGCDLSTEMVKAARNRGCYDEVVASDIRSVLAERCGQFDLLLAGDVFIYVGDLVETFRRASDALRENGLFAFTVETHEGSGYVLLPTRRYAHSLDYLRQLAAENGFAEQSIVPFVVRTDLGAGVPGWVVVLRKLESRH